MWKLSKVGSKGARSAAADLRGPSGQIGTAVDKEKPSIMLRSFLLLLLFPHFAAC